MDVSKGPVRSDNTLQIINKDTKPLTLRDKLICKYDDINNLEEVIDMERDLERYQKDTLRKMRPQ